MLRRVAGVIDRRAGLSRQLTYLYKSAKPCGWTPAPSEPILTWTLLDPGCVDRLSEIGSFEVSAALERLRRGDQCYTVCLEGRLAHYSWVQRSGSHLIAEAGMSVAVTDGEFWIYDCRTADWALGRRIYPATLARIIGDHFLAGYSTAWIYTSRENIASQRGILRAGFKPAAILRSLRVGTRYFHLSRTDQGQ
jgi:hypothetical protein